MRFRILGPLEAVRDDGERVPLGGPRLRALLGMLALNAGHVVPSERLIDALYGEHPPAGAANALQAQVSRLRQALRTDALLHHPAGYQLAVDPLTVDAHAFADLVAKSRFDEALDLWRGPPTDLPDAAAATLADLRLTAVEGLADTALNAADTNRLRALLEPPGPSSADTTSAGLSALSTTSAPGLFGADTTSTPGLFGADTTGAPGMFGAGLSGPSTTSAPNLTAAGPHNTALASGTPAVSSPSGTPSRPWRPGLAEVVAENPLREGLRARYMRVLLALGRPAEALVAFEQGRRLLADELGADPSPELAAAHLEVLRAEGRDVRRDLPAQLTRLIGREKELARIAAQLSEARLVTLTGPGGTGKTRLAVEAAGRVAGDVCFVELSPITDAAEVPQAVLSALGLREADLLTATRPGADPMGRPGADPMGRLVGALAGRTLLLVLDNCEHVVQAAADLTGRLLAGCPRVRVLATSREALTITGERQCPIPPLALPSPGAASAARFPSVQLFAERATAVRPDFDLDRDLDAVLRICRALDGLPLAIELAAARLRTLPAADIADRLPDAFALLSRGSRTAQPRHRTLRAVIEWSWALLDEQERTLARRLTVFSGGATLEAAEQVCAAPDALDLLASLADKSLVEVVGDRYRMLDTIRAFCAERLAQAGEEAEYRARHLAYFSALAVTADPYLRTADQLDWLRVLDAEHDNLITALRRAPTDDSLVMFSALTPYWWLRGRRSESVTLATELLGRLGPEPPASEEYTIAVLSAAAGGGRDPELERHLDRTDAFLLSHKWPPRQPYFSVLWAMVAGPPAPEVAQSMIEAQGRVADQWLVSLGAVGWGLLLLYQGQVEEADASLAEGLAGFRALGERMGMGMALNGMSEIAEWQVDRPRALSLLGEALALAESLETPVDVAELLCRRAANRLLAGDVDAAEADLIRSIELSERAGAFEMIAKGVLGRGEVARARGDLAAARALCEQALALSDSHFYFGADEVRTAAQIALGWVAEADGDADLAEEWLRRGLAGGLIKRNRVIAARVAEGLAGVALLRGDAARAATLLGVGHAMRGGYLTDERDTVRVAAECRNRLGDHAYLAARRHGSSLPDDQMETLALEAR